MLHLKSIAIHSDRFPNRRTFPFNVPVFGEPQELAFRRPVTLFVGENGSGKSTLLEAIARSCGVPVWDKPRRHAAHQNPYETELPSYVSVTWACRAVAGSLFRAETFREFADFLDDVALCDPGRLQYQGGGLLNTQSHGQGFLSYFSGRFQVKGLYLLDEPESALSPASQISFVSLLQQLEAGGQAQFIIATHSPFLLAYPGAQILSFDAARIQEVTCEETAHYRIYHQFFAQRISGPPVRGKALSSPDAPHTRHRAQTTP
jgi:predicted ATPase